SVERAGEPEERPPRRRDAALAQVLRRETVPEDDVEAARAQVMEERRDVLRRMLAVGVEGHEPVGRDQRAAGDLQSGLQGGTLPLIDRVPGGEHAATEAGEDGPVMALLRPGSARAVVDEDEAGLDALRLPERLKRRPHARDEVVGPRRDVEGRDE